MPVKGQKTREAIVIAARELFYHQGYNATSYADIGKRTSLGKGNIHYYFNSKDDLLEAVVSHRTEGIRLLLDEWTQDCASPHDCLERFIGMIEKNAGDLSEYGCPMGTLNDELGKNEQELQLAARKMFDLFLNWLEAHFQAIVPAEKAREYAETFLVMAQGISVVAHTYKSPEIVGRQVQYMRDWLAKLCANE